MKSNIQKRSMCLPLVVTVILMLIIPFAARSEEIPWGRLPALPDYIGNPVNPNPMANSGVPQDPFLAPYPFPHGHSDIWMSDTADIAGPLGYDLVTLSTTLAAARQYPKSWIISGGSISFDSHGRPILNCFGLQEASVIMVDPVTLQVLTSYPLEVQGGPPIGNEGDQKVLPTMWSIYGYLDNRDRIHIVSGNNKIITLREAGSPSSPVFEPVPDEEYDLSQIVDGINQRISGVIVDFQGRYWLNMGTSSRIYLLDPATAKYPYSDLPFIDLGGINEFTRNGMALTKGGSAYIVTTKNMYRVDADADDNLDVVWSVPYDTIDKVRPGQYELGSGTTPTILDGGKYVAITDNAPQMNVVVYRTDAGPMTREERVVCKEPVFNFPGGGAGADSNSLLGFHNSVIVQNTYNWLFDWKTGKLVRPGAPGMERIDINPDGKGCTKVWVNKEVTSNMCPRISTRTGLIYTQDRRYDTENHVYAVYWVALDFRTGKVVWEKLAGTFDKSGPARFDNFYAPVGIGPNGALYGPVLGGLTMIKDVP